MSETGLWTVEMQAVGEAWVNAAGWEFHRCRCNLLWRMDCWNLSRDRATLYPSVSVSNPQDFLQFYPTKFAAIPTPSFRHTERKLNSINQRRCVCEEWVSEWDLGVEIVEKKIESEGVRCRERVRSGWESGIQRMVKVCGEWRSETVGRFVYCLWDWEEN